MYDKTSEEIMKKRLGTIAKALGGHDDFYNKDNGTIQYLLGLGIETDSELINAIKELGGDVRELTKAVNKLSTSTELNTQSTDANTSASNSFTSALTTYFDDNLKCIRDAKTGENITPPHAKAKPYVQNTAREAAE